MEVGERIFSSLQVFAPIAVRKEIRNSLVQPSPLRRSRIRSRMLNRMFNLNSLPPIPYIAELVRFWECSQSFECIKSVQVGDLHFAFYILHFAFAFAVNGIESNIPLSRRTKQAWETDRVDPLSLGNGEDGPKFRKHYRG